MPESSTCTLIWNSVTSSYDLFTHGQLQGSICQDDDAAWTQWLADHAHFSFQGQQGRLRVIKEVRNQGIYWYAFHVGIAHPRKRYLGPITSVTLSRLEQEAHTAERIPRQRTQRGKERTTIQRQGIPTVPVPLTKFLVPQLPAMLVGRERLLRLLNSYDSHRLVLLSASAGSGKTTLLSSWATCLMQLESPPALAWLSVDALDNDPIRWWICVISTLRQSVSSSSTFGTKALALLHAPQPPALSTVVTSLINEILAHERKMILIVDDFHLIEEPIIYDTLHFLIEHLPTNLHLILSSRIDPSLPLPRLRVRGQLLEIRDQQVRFLPEEAARFLRQTMKLSLSEEEEALLLKRTGGWIAGLQLAALALRQHENVSTFVQNFSGSQRYLLDYVQQEILVHVPEGLRTFLLQSAILSRLSAVLCQAVTQIERSQQLLEEAEQSNFFLLPLDSERRWYRFHELFRETLLTRLHLISPELVPVLHLRAAHFYEIHEDWGEAIPHALAACDYTYAAHLLQQAAELLWRSGEVQAMHAWIGMLPDPILWQYARLALDTTYTLLFSAHMTTEVLYTRIQTQAEQMLTRLEHLCLLQLEERAVIKRRVRLLRALIESRSTSLRADAEHMSKLAQEAEMLSLEEELRWKILSLSLALTLIDTLQREGALLLPRLLEARQQAQNNADPGLLVRVMCMLVLAYLRTGELPLAEKECLQALALLRQMGEHTSEEGYLHYYLACIYFFWNQLPRARTSLRQTLRIGHDWSQIDLLIISEILLALIEIAENKLVAADQGLCRAEELVQQEGVVPHVSGVMAVRVQYWLVTGNLVQAVAWANHTVFDPHSWHANHRWAFLMQIRVYLAQQQYQQALKALDQFRIYLDCPGNSDATIGYLTLLTIVLEQSGERERAQATLLRLLLLSERGGYVRPFLMEGQLMQHMLETLLAAWSDYEEPLPSRAFVLKLLAAFNQEDHAQKQPAEVHPALSLAMARPFEALSPQELRVLRLLVTGRTNPEIANILVVSVNTVKTQVQSIYRKLGVINRVEAVATARHLRLL